MDFYYLSGAENYHPIARLLDPSNVLQVNGVVENVFYCSEIKSDVEVGKFSATFVNYLLAQGYEERDVIVVTSGPELIPIISENLNHGGSTVVCYQSASTFLPKKMFKVVIIAAGAVCIPMSGCEKFERVFEMMCLQAKCGLFVVGSIGPLQESSSGVALAVEKIRARGLVGSYLKLKCRFHGTESRARLASHFFDRGRCFEMCKMTLKCGHECLQLCHLDDKNHENQWACKRPCGRTCEYGHECPSTCHAQCEPCQFQVEKLLSCRRHQFRGSCASQPKECEELVSYKRYDCDHSVLIKCCDDVEKVLSEPCKARCDRRCGIGHYCNSTHDCGEPCPPCSTIVVGLYSRFCSHSFRYPCYLFKQIAPRRCSSACERSRRCDHPCQVVCGDHKEGECPPCEVIVNTVRRCGHEWTHPCYVGEESINCRSIVDGTSKAICDHPIEIECHIMGTLEEGEVNLFCDFPCGAYFDPGSGGCGHYCDNLCGKCIKTGIHGPCTVQLCGKIRFCGHACDGPCAAICEPCKSRCETKCAHGRCDKICGLPCDPCQELCDYGCKHVKCTAKCGEPCNVAPCIERCNKKLKCGHRCAGYCGDRCPPLCSVCDKNELLNICMTGKTEITQDDRFVLLLDCNHTIDTEDLEKLMKVSAVEGAILDKFCPICRTPIRKIPRYRNELIKIKDDMNKVKLAILGNQEDVQRNFILALECFSNICDAPVPVPDTRLMGRIRLGIQEMQSCTNPVEFYLSKAQNLAIVANLFLRAMMIKAKMEVHIPENLCRRIQPRLETVMEALRMRPWPMTKFELNEVLNEWDRVLAMESLFSKWIAEDHSLRLLRCQSKVQNVFAVVVSTLDAVGPFDKKTRGKYALVLEELEAALHTCLKITESERVEILAAFNNSIGRWFKCPNGHIYVVTECGGVTEEGQCNECGARIGGADHSLLPTNELASEMDGATQPLYPTTLSARV